MTPAARWRSLRRGRARLLATAGGVLAAAVCTWFVGNRLVEGWPSVRATSPARFALALPPAAAAMLVVASGWWSVLTRAARGETQSPDLTVTRTWGWFFAGEIGKYVPGTLWPILGRGELAVRGGIPRREAYRSVFLSLALFYLACAFVAAALRPWAYVPLVVATAAAARWLPVRLAARYLPAWLLIGTTTWVVARALDPDAPLVGVAAAAAASWLAGFLAVPVPGGVGVREAAFVAAVPSLSPGVAATTAVGARLAFVLVDAGAAVLAWHRLRRCGSST